MDKYFRTDESHNTWTDDLAWSTTDGGSSDTVAPTASDDAIFTENSGDCQGAVGTVRNVLIDAAYDSSNYLHIELGDTLIVTGSNTHLRQLSISGTLEISGTITFEGTSSKCIGTGDIVVKSTATVSGNLGKTTELGVSITVEAGATTTSLNVTNCNVYSATHAGSIASWTLENVVGGGAEGHTCEMNSSMVHCSLDTIADIYGCGDIESVGGTGISGSVLLGAGGCSGTAWIGSGSLTQDGDIETLKLSDPFVLTSYSKTSGIVTNLLIVSCSDTKTLDLDGMEIDTSIVCDGNAKLTLTGNVNYNGVKTGCTISNTTVLNCINSGNNIFALLTDSNVDGTGNSKWIFAGINLYLLAAGGAWDADASWSLTGSGGSADGRVPTELDTAYLQAGSGACSRTTGSDDCWNLIISGTYAHDLSVTNLTLHGDRSELRRITGTLEVNSGVGVAIGGVTGHPNSADINFHSGCAIYQIAAHPYEEPVLGDGDHDITFDEGMSDVFSELWVMDYNVRQASHTVTINRLDIRITGKTIICDALNITYICEVWVGGVDLTIYGGHFVRLWGTVNGSLTVGAGGIDYQLLFISGYASHTDLIVGGTIALMGVFDIATQLDSITTTGSGEITALYIDGCSAPTVFDLNGTVVQSTLSVDGTSSSNLTFTGDITYNGSAAHCNISNVSVESADASSGNPVYSLLINGNVNLHGSPDNLNWVFEITALLPYASIGTRATLSTGTLSISEDGLEVTHSAGAFDSNWGKGDRLVIDGDTAVMVFDNVAGVLILSDAAHAGESGLSFSLARAYSTIEAWEDDTDADLTAMCCMMGICYNDSDFTASDTIIFDGAITDATHYRKLTVAVGHRHLGNRAAGVNLEYTGATETYANQLQITESYFVLEYLRLWSSTYYDDKHTGRAIYCPGSSVAKNITINSVLIHDWVCKSIPGWNDWFAHEGVYGILIYQNGGCKVFNSLITDLYNINDDSDNGEMVGIFVDGSVADNWVANNTVMNITCDATYMKRAVGLGIFDTYTHAWNNISSIRRYVYDQSSIPSAAVEDYAFDFSGEAALDSDYNCERGGGYEQKHDVQGLNSLTNVDPFDVFTFPGPGPIHGNGFYGYAWDAHVAPFGRGSYPDNGGIYQVAPGESGKITFTNMFVFEMVAGYLYVDGSSYGALTKLKPGGTAFDDGAPTRTLSGIFSYDRTAGTFTQDSGDAELLTAIEMTAWGLIRFKQNYITTDWETLPIEPSGGSYTPDAIYTTLVAGFVTGPALLCIGQQHNDSFSYGITNRVLATTFDASLKVGSPCKNKGLNIEAYYPGIFPELAYSITGALRP